MHATKQPHISAKLFRKRLLQYCWKGKKEKVSVNERMNAKYHSKSKTKINSDRRKNVKSDNQLLCHWRDTLRLLCLKAGALWSLSRLSSTQQSCLYHQRTAALPAKGCKGKSGMFGQLPCFPASSLTFYFQVLTLPTRSFFLPNLKIPSRWLFFFFSPNWDIILRIWPRSDPTMSLFPVLQLVLRSSRKALKKSLTMQINV